jgi:hypothetical protein
MDVNRASIDINLELIHDLLHLPPHVQVLSVRPAPDGGRLRVAVASPELPAVPAGERPTELLPSYREAECGHAELMSLGAPAAAEGRR